MTGTAKTSDRKPGQCYCVNHLGTRKIQHKTRRAALASAIRKTQYTGYVRAYKCPTSNRWHLSTKPR